MKDNWISEDYYATRLGICLKLEAERNVVHHLCFFCLGKGEGFYQLVLFRWKGKMERIREPGEMPEIGVKQSIIKDFILERLYMWLYADSTEETGTMRESDWKLKACRMSCPAGNWCFREVTHFDQLDLYAWHRCSQPEAITFLASRIPSQFWMRNEDAWSLM